jgi:hypothetical protein
MAVLYTNYKNYPVSAHSYSGGSEFADCPKKYDYNRRQGYKEKEQRASSAFGTALEAAVYWYHNNNLDLYNAIDEWKRLWLLEKDKDLTYSEKDGDWESMYAQGEEMLRLYKVVLPSLPIKNPKFQINYKKELFPDTEYAGLQFTSFIDILSEVEWDHPALPPAICPQNGQRQIIIDMKTSGVPYPSDPRLSRLDPQLRSYAWGSGIETVAFLVFIKRSANIEKGDTVTLLESFKAELYPVGTELFVLDASKNILTLVTEQVYADYKQAATGLKGNALKDKVAEFALLGYEAAREEVTKQRIQFLAAVIPEEDRLETGEMIGIQARQICDANIQNFFPKRPGVRFPNNHCTFCSYLGLCIGDEKMVEEKLIQIGNVKTKVEEKDWLEEL